MTPPWIFGWSSYQPEGLLVTCSWDYTSRNLFNRLYFVYLLVLGFVLPIAVLIFCYSAIFRFVMRFSREITRLILSSDGRASFTTTTMPFRKRRKETDVRTALTILLLVFLFFTTGRRTPSSVSLVNLAHLTMTAKCCGYRPWRYLSQLFLRRRPSYQIRWFTDSLIHSSVRQLVQSCSSLA